MRVLIVDDEPVARRILLRFLRMDPDVTSIHECETGESAKEFIADGETDIMFLDIQMPGITGFETISETSEQDRPIIIFVTAFEQYALKAIEAGATDYLLKPFDEERFGIAFSRAKQRHRQETLLRKGSELASLLSDTVHTPPTRSVDRISVHDGRRFVLVGLDDISWIDAADKCVLLHIVTGTLRARTTLAEIEGKLDPRRFLRVHRSCIVALNHVSSLDVTPGGAAYLRLDDGTRVPVSRSRLPTLRARLR